jgi:hypothetical protein
MNLKPQQLPMADLPDVPVIYKKQFICYFHFVTWYDISLGISIDVKAPRLEIHVPFGFFRIGWLTHGVYDFS